MSEKANILFCDQCNKLLQDVPCPACEGKGYIREKLIPKRECNICDGRGQVRQCPDEFQHRLDRFETFSRTIFPSPNPFSPMTPKQPTKPPVQPPWRPNNPNSPLNPNSPFNPSRRLPGNPSIDSPLRRLHGDATTDALPPNDKKKK